jgi:hypothetical protein
MQATFMSILTDAGYLPHVDDDEVVFRVEGNRYAIQTFAGDDSYARLLTAFTLPTGVTRQRLLTRANERNAEAKAVKTVVEFKQGLVVFSVEQFLADPEHARPCFERALAAARFSADRFFSPLKPKTARRNGVEDAAA